MLLSLGCDTMREGVVATVIFLLSGVALILISAHVVPNICYLQHITMLVGFIVLLLAPIILISTFFLTVLPKAKKRMENCEH